MTTTPASVAGCHRDRLDLDPAYALRLAAPESALRWKSGLSVRRLYRLPVASTEAAR